MHLLTKYYIHQKGGGGGGGIGPIYSLSPYIQREHGIGDYLGPLFRIIKLFFFSGAKAADKALGRCSRTNRGSNSVRHFWQRSGIQDIISKHVQDTLQNLPSKMAGGGRERKRRTTSRRPAKRRRRVPSTKRRAPWSRNPKRRRST